MPHRLRSRASVVNDGAVRRQLNKEEGVPDEFHFKPGEGKWGKE
jgi:hypothetical protein